MTFIHAYSDGFRIPSADAEIADAMKVQPPSVRGMLKTLEEKQLIRRQPKTPRSIEILVDPALIPKWKKKLYRTVKNWVYTGNDPQVLAAIAKNSSVSHPPEHV